MRLQTGTFMKGIETFVLYVVLLALAACFIVPFFWLLSESLKSPSELFEVPTRWWPKTIMWSNYADMFNSFPFFLYLKNTIIILIPNIVGAVISNTLIAYGFARLDWKYRDNVFMIVLITMILPYQVTMIPLFIMFHHLHWIGTFLPLIVPSFFGNPFFIFLLRQFLLGIPKELSYSAKIDGANEFQIYARIIMPLAKPVISTVVIFAFLGTWNDFIGPLIFLSDNKLYTLSLGAQSIMGTYDPKWNILMALGVTMTVPVLVIFFLLQKYFIQGVAMSGIKG
ncbi:carbohydrate ABC transporter permease [Paenibacillus humicola]|uniref:carbohydrate ABC transporter permease n=1 Tax=Paenibacillus humicola TaxID=3110540 RepID=UPI00237B8DE4|nr:carbohydrate ABC transporter permease [Paenibacillus humicola]